MKKIILSPIFGGVVGFIAFFVFGICAWHSYLFSDATFMHDWHAGDIWTYSMYVLAFVLMGVCAKDFKGKYQDYTLFLFLMLCAVLREAGIQHMLTSTDTTAIKIHFFTNPNNPLWEKCRAAFLLLIVLGAAAIVLIKYIPKIWKGFWAKDPVYWSICTLAVFGIIGKISDRLPSRYSAHYGHRLPEETIYWFSIGEEGLEMCLPLLVAIAVLQHHFLKKQ